MESDRFDFVSRLIEISVADEMRGLGEILRKADSGVGRHGIMATVDSRYPQGRVNRHHERLVSWHSLEERSSEILEPKRQDREWSSCPTKRQ